jgi:hypothetical protein
LNLSELDDIKIIYFIILTANKIIHINNDFVFRFYDKIMNLPYDLYYINNFDFRKLISRFSVDK